MNWLLAFAFQAAMAGISAPWAFDGDHLMSTLSFGFCVGLAFSSLLMFMSTRDRP